MSPDLITRIQALVATHTRNGIVITDREQRIRWVNDGFTQLSGYTAKEAIGQKPGHLLQGPASDPLARKHIREAIDKREPFTARIINYHKNGTPYLIEISADPVLDASGHFDGYVAIQYDITEKEATLQRLSANSKALARINEVVLHLSADFNENLQNLTALAGELLEADCALYSRLEGGLLVSRGTWQTPPDFNPVDAPDGHLCFDVIRGEEGLLYVPDLQRTSYAQSDPNVKAYGLQTYIGHKVKAREQSVGSLCVVYGRSVALNELNRLYLSLVAQAICREEMLQQLRLQSELESSRLLTLLQSLDGAIIVEDNQRTVRIANRGLDLLFGAAPQSIVGQNCATLIPGFSHLFRDPESFVSSTHALIAAGKRKTGELLELEDGRWLERDFLPVVNNGQTQGILWHYREATEKVRTVRVLDAVAKSGQTILRKRLEGCAWNAPLAILGNAVEPDRVYVFQCHPHPVTRAECCSQVAEWVAAGVSPQIDVPELQNVVWEDYSTRWQTELSAGRVIYGEIADFPENEQGLLSMQEIQSILIAPIFSRETLWGFMGFDYCRRTRKWLTAEVALLHSAASSIGLRLAQQDDEDRLQQAMEAANAANVAKSRFLSTMSHEIRTPLNSVLGYTQLLRRSNNLSARERSQLETIHRSGKHLLTLINDILDISKIEAGRVNLNASEFDLGDFAAEVIEMLQARAEAKGLIIRYEMSLGGQPLPSHQAIWVRADIKALRQVLVNLLGNAVKFTHQGEVTLQVDIPDLHSDASRVLFSVHDTGIGIPANALPHLFSAFSQVYTNFDNEKGTGLGLAIVRGLVELMEGAIQVETEEGKGSCFHFTIPLPCKLTERTETCRACIEPEDVLRSYNGYQGARKRILIVDDVAENRMLLRDLLQPLGFLTAEATNGREALSMLDNERFDLILSDLVMPFMDGRTFAQHAKRKTTTAHIPIVAVSASVIRDMRLSNPLNQHFAHFLAKPIDANETLKLIGELLRLQWIYQEPDGNSAEREQRSATLQQTGNWLGESDLKLAYDLARMGDVDALQLELQRLKPINPQVIDPLLELLANYALNALCKGLENLIRKANS